MQKFDRFIEDSAFPELGFVEREATPEPAMKLGIRLHVAGLSFADTTSVLSGLGVDRARSTVHNWVQKTGLQPHDGKDPNHLAIDETVIQLNDQRYWLYAAVDPRLVNSCTYGSFTPERPASRNNFFRNPARTTTSPTACFSLMAHPGFRRRCTS